MLPKNKEGCPQLFDIEKRQKSKKDNLISCFIFGSFKPKHKFYLRLANVE
jgi:hypothetical protein